MDITYFKPGKELTFNSVVAIRNELIKSLEACEALVFCLDLTEVTHCDSAGLALLIEAKKLCEHNNKQFKVLGIPETTQSLSKFCGVNDFLETAQVS